MNILARWAASLDIIWSLLILLSCLQAYCVAKQHCQVKLKVGDKEVMTTIQMGLDPTFEETFEFEITDEKATKCSARFFMDAEPNQKQIGDEQEYILSELIIGKPVYKGLIVPGGKVDMMFTAEGFGKEEEAIDPSSFLDLMDGPMVYESEEEDA